MTLPIRFPSSFLKHFQVERNSSAILTIHPCLALLILHLESFGGLERDPGERGADLHRPFGDTHDTSAVPTGSSEYSQVEQTLSHTRGLRPRP